MDYGPVVSKAHTVQFHKSMVDTEADPKNAKFFEWKKKIAATPGYKEEDFWTAMRKAGKLADLPSFTPSASSPTGASSSLALSVDFFDAAATADTMSKDFIENLNAHKNLLYGATVSQVVGAAMKGIIDARNTGDAKQIVMDAILAVFCAFTISAEIHKMYNTHCRKGIWKEFEIKGARKGATSKDSWVSDSSMNATALKLLGQVIAASASSKSSLGIKAAEIGTIFKPVANESEYGKLTLATSKALTPSDTAAQLAFAKTCGKLVKVVEHLLENGGNNLQAFEDEMGAITSSLI